MCRPAHAEVIATWRQGRRAAQVCGLYDKIARFAVYM